MRRTSLRCQTLVCPPKQQPEAWSPGPQEHPALGRAERGPHLPSPSHPHGLLVLQRRKRACVSYTYSFLKASISIRTTSSCGKNTRDNWLQSRALCVTSLYWPGVALQPVLTHRCRMLAGTVQPLLTQGFGFLSLIIHLISFKFTFTTRMRWVHITLGFHYERAATAERNPALRSLPMSLSESRRSHVGDSGVPILACHSPGDCGWDRESGHGSLPLLKPVVAASAQLCFLAGPWQSTGTGFHRMEAGGTGGWPPTWLLKPWLWVLAVCPSCFPLRGWSAGTLPSVLSCGVGRPWRMEHKDWTPPSWAAGDSPQRPALGIWRVPLGQWRRRSPVQEGVGRKGLVPERATGQECQGWTR